jgi:uncharacterized protein HemX
MKKTLENWYRVNYVQAIALLRDDQLVWSADMDSIRKLLADVFDEAKADGKFELTTLNYLAEQLIAEENDLTI